MNCACKAFFHIKCREKAQTILNLKILLLLFLFISVDRVENKTLELQKVTRSQMGSYLCIATNGYPPAVSKKINLKVNFRPVITVPDLRIFIRPGEDVSLECIFEFHPRGLMWWER